MAYFRDLSQTGGQNNLGYASTNFGEEQLTFKRVVFGGGADVGIQFFLNSKKTAMFDLSIGFNFYPFPSNIPSSIVKGNSTLHASDYYYYDKGLDRIPKKIGSGKWESYNGAGINVYHCLSLGFMF